MFVVISINLKANVREGLTSIHSVSVNTAVTSPSHPLKYLLPRVTTTAGDYVDMCGRTSGVRAIFSPAGPLVNAWEAGVCLPATELHVHRLRLLACQNKQQQKEKKRKEKKTGLEQFWKQWIACNFRNNALSEDPWCSLSKTSGGLSCGSALEELREKGRRAQVNYRRLNLPALWWNPVHSCGQPAFVIFKGLCGFGGSRARLAYGKDFPAR